MNVENLPSYTTNHHTSSGYKNEEGQPSAEVQGSRFSFKKFIKFFISNVDVTTSLPLRPINKSELCDPSTVPIRVWWLGHACTLICINNIFILNDPVFDDHAAPISGMIKRVTPLPLSYEDLPPISFITFSHDHYDHLSYDTLTRLKELNPNVTILTPVGVHNLINGWNSSFKAVPIDWRQKVTVGNVTIYCFPARHYTRRSINDTNVKLWCSWLFEYNQTTVYYSGDTAIGPQFGEIRRFVGKPIDLALIGIGPQNPPEMMRPVHMNPQDAKDMSDAIEAKVVVPIHYGTFPLGQEVEKPDLTLLREAWQQSENQNELKSLKVGGRIDLVNGKFDVENEEMLIP